MSKIIKHLTQDEKKMILEYAECDGEVTLKFDKIKSLLSEIEYWESATVLIDEILIKNKEEKLQWQDITKQEQLLRSEAVEQYDRLELKYKIIKEKYNVAVYSLCSINADLDQLDKLYQLGETAREVLEQLNVNQTVGEKSE